MPQLQEKTKTGFHIPTKGLFGGEKMTTNWMRKEHVPVVVIRRQPSGNGLVQTTLNLNSVPQGKTALLINGIDNEKREQASLEIRVNGTVIFRGTSPWGKKTWSRQRFDVPAQAWKRGANHITILNTTPEKDDPVECGVAFSPRQDFFWGWFMLQDIQIDLKR